MFTRVQVELLFAPFQPPPLPQKYSHILALFRFKRQYSHAVTVENFCVAHVCVKPFLCSFRYYLSACTSFSLIDTEFKTNLGETVKEELSLPNRIMIHVYKV